MAGFAPESAFTDNEGGPEATDGGIFDADNAMVVGGLAGCGASRAIFCLGYFFAFIAGVKAVFLDDASEFEFRKQDKV